MLTDRDQFTSILSARHVFTYEVYGAMRALGYKAQFQRRRVWIISDHESKYFDLAHTKDLERFNVFRDQLLARATAKKVRR